MGDTVQETSLAAAGSAPAAHTGHYGPFARWLLSRLFDPVPFPAEAVPALREASRKATLVYVLRSSSLLHLLYFNYSFWKLGLPQARAATGLGYRIFAPFARWYLGGKQVRSAEGGEVANVVEAVRQGEAAMAFLRARRGLPSALAKMPAPFLDLIELHGKHPNTPIPLAPLTLL